MKPFTVDYMPLVLVTAPMHLRGAKDEVAGRYAHLPTRMT